MIIMAKCAFAALLALSPMLQDGSAEQYIGRWQVVGTSATGAVVSLGIVQITAPEGRLTATVIASPLPGFAVKEVALTDGQIVLTWESTGSPTVTMKGRRAGDRIEGTIGEKGDDGSWSATLTAAGTLQPPAETEDQKAFTAAMRAPRRERSAAFEKFLRDFPESPLKESARYQAAVSIRDSNARQAALTRFLVDFPDSRFRDEAFYKLIDLIADPQERIAAQEKYLADFPNGSMRENVYRGLLDACLRNKPVDESKISALIQSYVKSVPSRSIPSGRYTINRRSDACNAVARRLVQNDVLIDKALELAREAVASAGPGADPRARSTYLTTLGEVLYLKKDFEGAEQSLGTAIVTSGGAPNAEASLYLGRIYEARNNDAAALSAYLQAASFSGNADIKESLERLYRKRYGSLAGLHEKLDAIMLARPKPFDPGHYQRTTNEGGRVVLAELFTGAECPPCVAADQAFDGILDRYDRTTVAVLEWHLNIPGPDPMTNPDSELRAYYCGIAGTPGAVIDGIDRHFEERRANTAAENFKVLQDMIEPRLAEAPGATFSGLSLRKDAGKVIVSGEVRWPVPSRNPERFRLRIALVEDTVHYTGSNGIHFHHMVVRKMLGPADGIILGGKTGKTAFSESVSLADVEAGLKAYLDRYEKEYAAQRGDFRFAEKPYRIDPGILHAVVFVQDGETMQVVQSAYVN